MRPPATAADFYRVTVTWLRQDLYEVADDTILIGTRFRSQIAHDDDAMFRIDDPTGSTVGELIFSNTVSCEVARIVRR